MFSVPSVSVDRIPDPLPDGLTVLDVREPVEWVHGHIEGSMHVPLHDLPARLDELPTDRQILVVCRVGGRSAQAVAWLQRNGLDAVNLDGGLVDWADAGRALVSDAGHAGVV
jgi:rhodanese-related sulfurtransferase